MFSICDLSNNFFEAATKERNIEENLCLIDKVINVVQLLVKKLTAAVKIFLLT